MLRRARCTSSLTLTLSFFWLSAPTRRSQVAAQKSPDKVRHFFVGLSLNHDTEPRSATDVDFTERGVTAAGLEHHPLAQIAGRRCRIEKAI